MKKAYLMLKNGKITGSSFFKLSLCIAIFTVSGCSTTTHYETSAWDFTNFRVGSWCADKKEPCPAPENTVYKK